ncbi:DUF4352 domain-containing protein [Abyssisolibacter fermentans]|uniref:DUF4352 domain-containing protein n=1 Tax=Abyssisolibacter fermentans TaxID=1766203 RepID=UPI00082E9734|nr:DUF4352 domain-containing protein [Abyssisolibacter fermentans]
MKKIIVVMTILALLLSGCSNGNDDSSKKENQDMKSQIEDLNNQIKLLENNIKQKDSKINDLNNEIAELKDKISSNSNSFTTNDQYQEENSIKIGQEVKYKDVKFKVDEIYKTDVCKIKLDTNDIVEYKPENKFLLVQVSGVNASLQNIKLDNFKYKLIEKNGTEYNITLKTGEIINYDKVQTEIMGGKNLRLDIEPKVKKTGVLLFDVPNVDAEYKLKIYYKDDNNLEMDYNGVSILLKK